MSPTPRIRPLARIAVVVTLAIAALAALGDPAAFAIPPADAASSAANPSRVRVTSPSERGTPLEVYVRIFDAKTGRAIPGAKLFVYQTDDAGYYDRGEDGRERGPRGSRLHATAYSDAAGAVVFDTVVPGSYPGSGVFRHIHYTLSAAGYTTSNQEIILDEAPRPTEEQKRWAARNGDVVARREPGKGRRSELRVTLKLQPSKEG